MNVLALTNSAADDPHWIDRAVFFSHFDQDDFSNREVQAVRFAYRSDWFHYFDDGTVGFYIPVTGAIGRRTDLIGTRHRVAVLLPYMTELPMAFATGHLTSQAQGFLASIPKKPLIVSRPFWIPDLPILDTLP